MRYYAAAAVLGFLLFSLETVSSPALPTMADGKANPNPDANGNYHVGDGVTAPKAISAPDPELPKEARQKRIIATVLIWVIVEADGSTKDVHVAKSSADDLSPDLEYLAGSLDKNAIEAAKKDRFQPATLQGKPVPVQIQVKCRYKPRNANAK